MNPSGTTYTEDGRNLRLMRMRREVAGRALEVAVLADSFQGDSQRVLSGYRDETHIIFEARESFCADRRRI
jgi:hypothetical protein